MVVIFLGMPAIMKGSNGLPHVFSDYSLWVYPRMMQSDIMLPCFQSAYHLERQWMEGTHWKVAFDQGVNE